MRPSPDADASAGVFDDAVVGPVEVGDGALDGLQILVTIRAKRFTLRLVAEKLWIPLIERIPSGRIMHQSRTRSCGASCVQLLRIGRRHARRSGWKGGSVSIVHTMPQRSPEWFAIRRGKITGSEIGKFVYNTDKKAHTSTCGDR